MASSLSSPASPSPAATAEAAESSSSSSSSSSVSMGPPVHSLLGLSIDLLEHILRYVPLRIKLQRLTHLSHAFPLLTPACFTEDALKANGSAVAALNRSAPLQSLLSRVQDLSLCALPSQMVQRGRRQRPARAVQLPLRLVAFSRLQSLTIRLEESNWYESPHKPLDVRDVLTSLSSLPLLQSLSIEALSQIEQLTTRHSAPLFEMFRTGKSPEGGIPTCNQICRFLRPSDFAALSRLPSLRSLTLSEIKLAAGALYLLCSLPLQQLDLGGSSLGHAEHDNELVLSDPPTAGLSFSLRRLHLPQPHTHSASNEIKQVVEAYCNANSGRGDLQLEVLKLNQDGEEVQYDEELQPLLWCFPSLTELTLAAVAGDTLLPEPASSSLKLPLLRCLRLVVFEPEVHQWRIDRAEQDAAEAQRRHEQLSQLAGECDSLLHSYARQLLRLDVIDLPNQPAAAAILQAAVHCQQLRYLMLEGHGQNAADNFAAVSFAQLPHLHTLSLENVRISTAQLTSLLQSCPAVEHVFLGVMPAFTLELLPVIGRSCRLLKQLDAEWCEENLFSQPVAARLTQAEQAARNPLFPQLMALTLRIEYQGEPEAFPSAPPQTVQWLLRVLHSAPVLRFLRLHLELDDIQLQPFASLPALRGLCLYSKWAENWKEKYFYGKRWPDRPDRILYEKPKGWQPMHEAERERRLAVAMRQEGGLFLEQSERFDGCTGREAFWAASAAHLASVVAAAESRAYDFEGDDVDNDADCDEEDGEDGKSESEDEDDPDADDDGDDDADEEEKTATGEKEARGEASGRKRRRPPSAE